MNVIARKLGIQTTARTDAEIDRRIKESKEKIIDLRTLAWTQNSLTLRVLEPLDALIVTKSCAGFDRGTVDQLARLLEMVAKGELPGLKYLVFDFAHRGETVAEAADGFEDLVAANAELILEAPVISVAWARSFMNGVDLDFALYCSMAVAEKDARFSFDGDPMALFGLYAALARKIGFVKTERLIDNGEVLGAEAMRDLCLVTDVIEARDDGGAAIEQFIGRSVRRYNASCAIYRAQRMTMPRIDREK